MKLCSYGCEKEAKFILPNNEMCCSDKHTKCSSFQSKITYAKEIDTIELCDYGCGKEANYIFRVSNKFCCSKRLQSCSGIRKRNSEKNKIKQPGSNNGMFGRKHSEESKEKNRQSNKNLWSDPDSFFNSKEWKKRLGKSMNVRPNFPEKQILNFLDNFLPGKFSYTGDFSFWLGRKNPDFVDKNNKKIIEFFGNHFHEKSEEMEREEYFKKYGYETLVIWETQFRLEKERTFKRIIEFGG